MANDMEALARALMASPQGPALAKGLEKLTALQSTQEGQAFLAALTESNPNTVKTAAEAVMKGDRDAAKNALLTLFSTKEGAVIAAKLAELLTK